MRQLFPQASEDPDPLEVYRHGDPLDGRPGVRVNMIASADGAATVGGLSGALGGSADRRLFQILRTLADVVMVGAGTLRAEHYGPARLPSSFQDLRAARGQAPQPAIAVITRSCDLDWGTSFFTEAATRPVVITVRDAPAQRVARASEVSDVVVSGDGDVDLARAIGALGDRGAKWVLVEGGPILNGQLAAEGLLDELCLTISPCLFAGDGPRVLNGSDLPAPLDMALGSVCEEDDFLFLRYKRR